MLIFYMLSLRIQIYDLQVVTNKSTEKWFCARALAEKFKCIDRKQMANFNEGWPVRLEMLLNNVKYKIDIY